LLFWDDGLTSLSIGGLLSEVSLKGNFGNHCKNSNAGNANATLWEDNLTNISIGGLFSEASLQDRWHMNNEREPAHNGQSIGSIGGLLSEASILGEGRISDCNKTWETRRAIKQPPLPLISDSLDAFLVNQTDNRRAPCPAPLPESSHSSILDAEDTCHAFSFRKRTTITPKVHDQVKCFSSYAACLFYFITKHFRYCYCQKFRTCNSWLWDMKIWQVSGEVEKEKQIDESNPAKPLLGSSVFNQDSSLGLSGIKWVSESSSNCVVSASHFSKTIYLL